MPRRGRGQRTANRLTRECNALQVRCERTESVKTSETDIAHGAVTPFPVGEGARGDYWDNNCIIPEPALDRKRHWLSIGALWPNHLPDLGSGRRSRLSLSVEDAVLRDQPYALGLVRSALSRDRRATVHEKGPDAHGARTWCPAAATATRYSLDH
jgi:hypothetical protein